MDDVMLITQLVYFERNFNRLNSRKIDKNIGTYRIINEKSIKILIHITLCPKARVNFVNFTYLA